MTVSGDRVRALRVAKGLSQQAVACAGLSAGYLSLIEAGKRTPSARMTALLADRLDISVDELSYDPNARSSDQAQVEVNFARLALANGDPAEAVRCLSQIRPDELVGGAARDAALVQAEGLHQMGHLDKAVDVLETLIQRCRREGSWVSFATAATALAVIYIESGDIARSVDVAESAVEEVAAAGLAGTDEHVRLASVHVSSLWERGDLVFATRCVKRLIEAADRVASTRGRGSVYWNAASVALERGRFADAVALTDRAVAFLSELEEGRELPRLRLNYAWILLSHEPPRAAEAIAQVDRAESSTALVGSRVDRGIAATYRGRAFLVLGQIDRAAEQAARALQLLGPSEHVERVGALILLGDVGVAHQDTELARESFTEAVDVLTRMTAIRTVARLWRELGDGWRDLGETTRAMDAYDRSFRIVGLAPRPATASAPSTAGRASVVPSS